MKSFLKSSFLALLLAGPSFVLQGQTSLSTGNLYMTWWNSVGTSTTVADNRIGFLTNTPLSVGTTIHFTSRPLNANWATQTTFATIFDQTNTAGRGTLSLTLDQDVAPGESIYIDFFADNLGSNSALVRSNVGDVVNSEGSFGIDGNKVGGNTNDILFVYQTTSAGAYNQVITAPLNIITGFTPLGVAPTVTGNLVWGNNGAANLTGFILNRPVNANQCGCWTKYDVARTGNGQAVVTSIASSVVVNSELNGSSYSSARWVTSSSSAATTASSVRIGTTSNYINACLNTTTAVGLDNILYGGSEADGIKEGISYATYRWGFNGIDQWEVSTVAAPATFTTTTLTNAVLKDMGDKKVIFYKDYTLNRDGVSFVANTTVLSTQHSYTFGSLEVNASQRNVTLTIEPGIDLSIGTLGQVVESGFTGLINFRSERGGDPFANNSHTNYYAQLLPTSATLTNFKVKYDLRINAAGFHHLASPFSTTVSSLSNSYTGPSGVSGLNVFSPSGKVKYWNNTTGQWVNTVYTSANGGQWLDAGGSDLNLTRPVSIRFLSNEVPALISFEGIYTNTFTAAVSENITWNKPSDAFSSFGSNGAPWVSTASAAGWNIYRNPYLTLLDASAIVSKNGAAMTNTSLEFHVWQACHPVYGSIRSWTGTAGGGFTAVQNTHPVGGVFDNYARWSTAVDVSGANDPMVYRAKYISPFQAYWVRHVNITANPGLAGSATAQSGGPVKTRSEVRAQNIWQKKNSSSKVSTSFYNADLGLLLETSELEERYSVGKQYLNLQPVDGNLSDFENLNIPCRYYPTGLFALAQDSILFSVKTVPTNFDSVSFNVGVTRPFNGLSLKISNSPYFDGNYRSLILDRKTGRLHDLSKSSYYFDYNEGYVQAAPRFKWFVGKSGYSIGIEDTNVEAPFIVNLGNGSYQFVGIHSNSGSIIDFSGRLVESFKIDSSSVLNTSLPVGLYTFVFDDGTVVKFINQ